MLLALTKKIKDDRDGQRQSLRAALNVFILEQQEKAQIKKELRRIEDVIAGLSTNKANYKVTISSVTNPGLEVPHLQNLFLFWNKVAFTLK